MEQGSSAASSPTSPGQAASKALPTTPRRVWAIGWDKRSVILKLLDAGQWRSYRLPIGDYSYVARHGWYTEWPRIRDAGGGKLLMNMHGQWFDFPKTFSTANTAGIRAIGDYLKITGDFCPWKVGGREQLVFGCDDASIMENPLALQSQSNLWFSSWDGLAKCGRPAGFGGPWVDDAVKAGEPSEPFYLPGIRSASCTCRTTRNSPSRLPSRLTPTDMENGCSTRASPSRRTDTHGT